jgi:SRSO17 transposase
VAYLEGFARAAGHGDRLDRFKDYHRGPLVPGERRSIGPIAAHLQAERVRAAGQSLHHQVANDPWRDDCVLAAEGSQALPDMDALATSSGLNSG